MSARKNRIDANARRIAELQDALAAAKRLKASGIDPVTLKNLPRYEHEVAGAPAIQPVVRKVDIAKLVDKFHKK